jgi:transcriptional regulator with AAA-type ATPase domain/polyferredoxin
MKEGPGGGSGALVAEAVEYLQSAGERVRFAPGQELLRRGDEVRRLYVILRGEVEVRLQGEGGLRMTVARLSAGATVGEMGLVTGDPASADVVAAGEVEALAYPGERFHTALDECEPFRRHVLARLADSLRATTLDAWSSFCRARALADLSALEGPAGALVAASLRMKKVERAISELAASPRPLAIRGEPGCGKLFAARTIHAAGPLRGGPLIVIDCSKLGEGEGLRSLLGSESPSNSRRRLAGFGAIHLADGGTLVLRRIDALAPDIQSSLEEALGELEAAGPEGFPRFRLVATSAQDLGAMSRRGGFDARLARRLSEEVLELPPLRDRRHDVLALARLFLGEFGAGQTLKFTKDAEAALLSHRYGHGNVQELREAVRLAALFAESGEVRQEHIFTGPKQQGVSTELDLTRSAALQWLLKGNRLQVVRLAVFAAFVTVAAVCLASASTPAGRVSNALVWGLWEPALILCFLLAGRIWCTACPLAFAGRALKLLTGGLDRAPPAWMKRWGLAVACAGFAFIIWIERALHMTREPRPTGFLLVGLMALAALFAVTYQREVWCRFICPLGTLGAAMTAPAALQVRANALVCGTQCTTHECFRGSPGRPGCSVFHHPLYASDSHACKLCLNCLSACPHGSVRLYLRTPLQAVWRQLGLSGALGPFSYGIFALSMAMLAAQEFPDLSGPWTLGALAGMCVALGYGIASLLPRLLCREEAARGSVAGRVGFSLIILAWGPLMAYQLKNIPVLQALFLRASEGSLLGRVLPAGGMGVLPVLQLAAVAAAWAGAVLALRKVRSGLEAEGSGIVRGWGWGLLHGICFLYAALAAALLVLGPILER